MNDRFLIEDDTTTETAVDGGRRVTPTNEFIEFDLSEVDQSLPERFERQVLQYPGHAAVTSSGRRVTYEELNRRANQIAGAILDARGDKSEPVALLLDQGPMMIAALWGALKSGKICVTLDAAYPPDRIEAMLDDSESPLIVTDGGHLGRIARWKASKRDVLNLDNLKTPLTSNNVAVAIPPDTLADLVYTSGSTGVPKGIPRSHRMLLHGARLYTNHCHLGPDDRLTLLHSISFAAGVAELFAALLNGASTNYWDVRTLGVAGMADWLIEERITFFHWFPTAFRQFVRTLNGNEEFPDLRVIQLGSEPLIDRDLELYRRHFGRQTLLANRMGTSETVVFSFFFADHETTLSGTTIPIGYEAQDKEVLILDERGNEIGFDEVGEIAVRTRYLSPGYWRRPDLTEKAFLPDPDGGDRRIYKTGDLGLLKPDGCIEFFGRKDTQVKIRGHRVEVAEIESLLLDLESVRNTVVVPREDDNGATHLAAFIIPAETEPQKTGQWKQFLAEKLPGYMVPSVFVTLDAFPLTPSGKVDRRSLSKLDIDHAQLETEYVAPRTSLEQGLSRIWARSLGLERVGIRDDFFALGGHSLNATEVVWRIRESMNVELPIVALFESPNIEQLAGRIESLQSDGTAGAEILASSPTIVPSPTDRNEPFPMTDVQQAYWVGRSGLFELGNVTTHSYVELDCVDLDLERLQSTWRQLIERHDMLRAIVQPDGNQRVLKEVPEYRFKVVDLRGTDRTTADREIEALRRQMSHQVLPSDRWPLFEIRACRLGDRRYRLHFSFDALIFDAWSRTLLFHEWRQLYERPDTAPAGIAGLPPLELTFRDYVLAERALRETKQYERAKQYWLDRLPKLPAAPELPLAKSPTAVSNTRFVRRTARLDKECWEQLKKQAGQSGLTPSGALLAAFSEVLKRWSKNPRFTLNLTLYNRLPLHPQVNEVVGDFTSLMLLEVDNSEQDTFESRARRLERQFWNDLDHREFNAIEVLREMARQQAAGPQASMPVVFTSLLHQANRLDVGEKQFWMGQVVFRVAQTPQVWLDHVVFEEAGEVTLTWDAVEELFPEELLDDMFDSYCRLLKTLSEHPELWNRDWREVAESLLPPAQQKRLASINATKTEIPEGLLQTRFVEQAQRQPQKPAVVSAERTLSYEQLWRMSNQIGRELSRRGARPNRLVAVVMEKGWEQVAAVLGVLQSGAAYLPIEANLPQQRICQLLELGEVELVLTQSKFDRQLDWPESIRRLCVDDEPARSGVDESELEPVQSPEDLAYVIFTSGSTGQPKGVAIDHRGALNTIVDVNRRFGVNADDRVLALSSLGFDLSVYDMFGTLAAGGTIVIPEATEIRNPARWAEWMQREQVTLWNSVPALMELLVEWADGRRGLIPDSLRLVMLSGDWIPVTLPDQIRSLVGDIEVISLGGATEASIWSILYPIDSVRPSWKSIPYGKPMVNQTFHVLGDEMEPCPVWTTGQLFIGGIGLARSYWRDKQTTGDRFIVHPRTGERLYRTGDLGRFLPDGNIEFLGREDFQVKIQGHRIDLGEIEAALGQHRDVKQAVVTALGSSTAERRLVAYVVGEETRTPEPEELRRYLLTRLPGYMVPAQFVALSRFPLTSNGKIDRRALRAPADAGRVAPALPVSDEPLSDPKALAEPVAHVPAEPVAHTPAEAVAHGDGETLHQRIGPLVCGVMCLESIEPNASLLNLGATSIDMIRIINLLEKNFGFRPSINDFYREPTVAYLARTCDLFRQQKLTQEGSFVSLACPQDPASYPLLSDPIERDEFKYGQPGLRRIDASRPSVGLQKDAFSESVKKEAFLTRRSYRRFANQPISAASFGAALAALRQIQIDGRPKYLYGSAGGLYAVQSYLYVKPNRVAGLQGGYYYYDPVAHRVVLLSDEASLDADVFDPFINGPVFAQAAFGLFLVAQVKAIAPMYREQSLHLTAIEAGMMAQLLEMTGPEHGIGYCQIGTMNFDSLRQPLQLEESHVPTHALLGGSIESATPQTWSPFQEGCSNVYELADDREEGVL